jgi:hydrogenase-4 membrane subunit HyfE
LVRLRLIRPVSASRNANADRLIGEEDMPLVNVVLTLLVVGVLLWLVNRFIPMQSAIKGILNAVVVIAVVLWMLKLFGLWHYVTQFRIGS